MGRNLLIQDMLGAEGGNDKAGLQDKATYSFEIVCGYVKSCMGTATALHETMTWHWKADVVSLFCEDGVLWQYAVCTALSALEIKETYTQ